MHSTQKKGDSVNSKIQYISILLSSSTVKKTQKSLKKLEKSFLLFILPRTGVERSLNEDTVRVRKEN